jgi:hypothetical protein
VLLGQLLTPQRLGVLLGLTALLAHLEQRLGHPRRLQPRNTQVADVGAPPRHVGLIGAEAAQCRALDEQRCLLLLLLRALLAGWGLVAGGAGGGAELVLGTGGEKRRGRGWVEV